MSKRSTALTASLLGLLLATIWACWPAPTDAPAAAPQPDTPGPPTAAQPAKVDRIALPSANGELQPEPFRRLCYPADRDRGPIEGTVVDADLRVVADARVTCLPVHGGTQAWLLIGDERERLPATTSDADGTFRFVAVPHGPWELRATLPDGREGARTIAVPTVGVVLLAIGPSRGHKSLRVTDVFGAPIPGAHVAAFVARDGAVLIPHDREPDLEVTSAADGYCKLHVDRPWALLATAPDGRQGVLVGNNSFGGHGHATIRVASAGGIDGSLTGMAPTSMEGSVVQALAVTNPEGADGGCHGLAWTAPVRGSGFGFRGLPAGRYLLVLQSPRGLCLQLPTRSTRVQPWNVEVPAGAIATTTMAVGPGRRILGSVAGPDGRALAGARVTAVLVPGAIDLHNGMLAHGRLVWRLDAEDGNANLHPTAHVTAVTTADGRYELAGLLPRAYGIRACAPGYAFIEHDDLDLTATTTVTQDFTLQPAGVVQGVVDETPYFHIAALRQGSDQPALLAILPNHGTFTLPGLAPGPWTLASWDAKSIKALGTVEVVAGRTSWIDLRQRDPVRISGRVVDAHGQPVAGGVRLGLGTQLLGPDGTFAFRRPEPLDSRIVPALEVCTANLHYQLPVPEAAFGTQAWDGEFRLGGPCELNVLLQDDDGRALTAEVFINGPCLDGVVHTGPTGASLRDLPAGKYTASVHLSDALVPFQRFELPATGPLVLHASRAAVIDVHAVDPSGRPRPGRHIAAYATPDGQRPLALVRTDEDGNSRLLVLPGQVWVTPERYGNSQNEVIAVQAQLGPPAMIRLTVHR